MPTTISRGVYQHGKRHRFSVTAIDDSEVAFKAALEELDRQVAEFTSKISPTNQKQSYRKKKR